MDLVHAVHVGAPGDEQPHAFGRGESRRVHERGRARLVVGIRIGVVAQQFVDGGNVALPNRRQQFGTRSASLCSQPRGIQNPEK